MAKKIQNINELNQLFGKEKNMTTKEKDSATYYSEVKRLLDALGIKGLACMIELVVKDKFPEDSEQYKVARKFWKATWKIKE